MSKFLREIKWPIESLAQHTHLIETGGRPSGGVSKYVEGIPSISAEQISEDGVFKWDKIKYVPVSFFKNAQKGIIKLGDILVVKDGATTGKCAYVDSAFPFMEAMINEHTYLLRTKPTLFSQYAYYFLKSPYCSQYFKKRQKHGVIGGLNNNFIQDIMLPVPPLDEQRRIVARIEELTRRVEEARKLRQDSISETLQTVTAMINKMLFDYGSGWEECTLGDVLDLVQYGTSAKAHTEPKGMPVIRMGNIQNGRILTDDLKYLELPEKEMVRYRLCSGDILINRTNSAELVGKAGLFDLKGDYIFASYLIRLRVKSNLVEPAFVNYAINSDVGQAFLRNQGKQAIGQSNINSQQIRQMPLHLPPLNEQRRIIKFLDTLRHKASNLTMMQHDTEVDLAKFTPAFLAKAFRGEV